MMKNLRITPLNMVMAGLFTWLLWQINDGNFIWEETGWILLLFIILVAADQLFRVLIRDLRKIWLIEGGFMLLVAAVLWIVRNL